MSTARLSRLRPSITVSALGMTATVEGGVGGLRMTTRGASMLSGWIFVIRFAGSRWRGSKVGSKPP